MNSSNKIVISVGARTTPLARAQVKEVLEALQVHHPKIHFEPIWIKTAGDKDLSTSLRSLEKTDFFTREIDALQLSGGCRISIHSAKDLPEPLPKGLEVVALTEGVDSSDVLVLRKNTTLSTLPQGARIGTSSDRREKNIKELREDLDCVNIRGSILSRLEQLDKGRYDGVVMAEAALIRLGLTKRNRILLSGERAPLQGQLAVVALSDDAEMHQLFQSIDARK